jgi:hypothetical protein
MGSQMVTPMCMTLVVAMAMLSTGCHKHDNPPTPPVHKDTICQIKSLSDSTVTLNLFYDSLDRPVKAEYPGAGHNTNQKYYYDSLGRLSYRITYYQGSQGVEGDPYNELHQYYYFDAAHPNRVTIDTITFFGTFGANGPVPGDWPDKEYDTYRYDAQGKVNYYDHNVGGEIQYQTSFYYAANNLQSIVQLYSHTGGDEFTIIYGPYSDTTSVNMNATNPIWQFLNMDYSVNSPDTILAANDAHLTTRFSANKLVQLGTFNSWRNLHVTYQCK